jgi:hypothetical protein
MDKPTKKVVKKPMLNYNDIIKFIEEKYNILTRDYACLYGSKIKNKEGHYEKYQRITGDVAPKDNAVSSQEYYKRYKEWVKDNPEPPYLDYWHWLLEHCFSDISNGTSAYFNVSEILEDDKTPDWVKEITKLIYDEFNDELDDDGGVEVWNSW